LENREKFRPREEAFIYDNEPPEVILEYMRLMKERGVKVTMKDIGRGIGPTFEKKMKDTGNAVMNRIEIVHDQETSSFSGPSQPDPEPLLEKNDEGPYDTMTKIQKSIVHNLTQQDAKLDKIIGNSRETEVQLNHILNLILTQNP
jgi:hypothetical protein